MNFDGPVRVASTVGSGTATVTLSFDNWKGANVVPTTHAVQVLPAKESVKVEPVSDKLVGTLVHPDRKASLYSVAFSPDGSRLFATGYPSGVVQVFDAASRKELRRIETPPGPRASGEYAALTPDWKTLYVPVEVRKVKSVERDGKQVMRVEESGRIRVWDVATGEERAALRPPDGSAPAFARLSPDGQALVCVERTGFDADADVRPADVTVIWDLTTRTRRKLWDGFQVPVFAPDGKRLAIQETDHQAKTSALRLLDAGTSKELARLDCPEKGPLLLGRELFAGRVAGGRVCGRQEGRAARGVVPRRQGRWPTAGGSSPTPIRTGTVGARGRLPPTAPATRSSD